MGKVKGAPPKVAAVTVLKEETRITAGKLTQIAQWWMGPGTMDILATLFIAENLSFGEATPEENEFFEIKKISIKEVGEMINRGEILDGPTIVAYHYLENYLKKKNL